MVSPGGDDGIDLDAALFAAQRIEPAMNSVQPAAQRITDLLERNQPHGVLVADPLKRHTRHVGSQYLLL
jgi:hypothetical protein